MKNAIDKEQQEIDRLLDELHAELSAFIFTAARDWQRSLKVDAEKRSLLCFAIRELQLTRAHNHAMQELERRSGAN